MSLPAILFRAVVLLARALYRVLGWPIQVHGLARVPADGPIVVVSNHVSHVDPIHLGLALVRRRRHVAFLGKREVFAVPVLGWLLRTVGQVEVDRDGEAHRAVEAGVAALRRGSAVVVFPEGTISTSFVPVPPKIGAARMAAATGAQIVPAAVWGGQRVITKGRSELRPPFRRTRGVVMAVRFGEPLAPVEGEDPGHLMARAWERVGELAEEAARSYPQAPAGPEDRWWVPQHLGGTAPGVAEALAVRAAEAAQRRARRQAAQAGREGAAGQAEPGGDAGQAGREGPADRAGADG